MKDDVYKKRMSVEVPARCTLHQCVKGRAVSVGDEYEDSLEAARCILCRYYTLNLESKKCNECLHTQKLDGFSRDEYAPRTNGK